MRLLVLIFLTSLFCWQPTEGARLDSVIFSETGNKVLVFYYSNREEKCGEEWLIYNLGTNNLESKLLIRSDSVFFYKSHETFQGCSSFSPCLNDAHCLNNSMKLSDFLKRYKFNQVGIRDNSSSVFKVNLETDTIINKREDECGQDFYTGKYIVSVKVNGKNYFDTLKSFEYNIDKSILERGQKKMLNYTNKNSSFNNYVSPSRKFSFAYLEIIYMPSIFYSCFEDSHNLVESMFAEDFYFLKKSE